MEPLTVFSIAKVAGDISTRLYELAKSAKDRDVKQQIDELLDKLTDLKRAAVALEDDNRELKEKLRFQSEEFEFKSPFWYDKTNPDRALCPKCFAKQIEAPMGEQGRGCSQDYRRCLVCDNCIEIA